MVQNPLLKYSIERLLNEANPEGETFFGATAFNKMIFLLHQQLLRNDVDIKLPYYWYLHGSLIEENQFEEDVGHPRQYYLTSDRSSRRMMTVPRTSITEHIQQVIDRHIHILVESYKQPNGRFFHDYVDILLDDVYAQAPYEFQRVFNRKFIPFLDSFRTPRRRQVPASLSFVDADLERIEILLDDSLKVFPQEDMGQIYDTYLEWDDTVRITIEFDEKQVFPLTESFWKFFCQNLRIHKNENLSSDLIRHWDSRFNETVLPKYQSDLEKLRRTLLKKWSRGQEEDTEIDALVKKLNLISRDKLGQSDT